MKKLINSYLHETNTKNRSELTAFSVQWRVKTFLVESTITCAITEYNVIIWEGFTQLALCTDYLDAEKANNTSIIM